jgi:hypothetical protein
MIRTKPAFLGNLLFTALVGAMSAGATPFAVTSGSSLSLDFNGFYESSPIVIPGLSGVVNLSNFDFTSAIVNGQQATRVTLSYEIINNSTSPVLTSRISNFAFDTTPTLLSTTFNQVTGVFNTIEIEANQPNGIGTVEICFTAQNCPGGGSGGVTMGNTGTGTATLYFGGTIDSISIDNAVLRYQSVTCTPGSPCSGSASGALTDGNDDPPGGDVPEPSTYVMMSLGIAGIAIRFLGRK